MIDDQKVHCQFPSWNNCEHEWVTAPGDWDSCCDHLEQVICKKCKCPGELDTRTNEVFWPAT